MRSEVLGSSLQDGKIYRLMSEWHVSKLEFVSGHRVNIYIDMVCTRSVILIKGLWGL